MPIRLEHQPSPAVVGGAAYVFGAQRAKKSQLQQQQKYAMDLYRDKQQMFERRRGQFMDFKYNEALNRQRAAAIETRDARLRTEALADEARGRAFKLEDEARGKAFALADETRRRVIAKKEEMRTGASEWTPAAIEKIRKMETDYATAATSGSYTPATLADFRTRIEAATERLLLEGGTQPPSALEKFKRRGFVRDPLAPGGVRPPRRGEVAKEYFDDSGAPQLMPPDPTVVAAEKGAEKAEKAATAQQAKVDKWQNSLHKTATILSGGVPPDASTLYRAGQSLWAQGIMPPPGIRLPPEPGKTAAGTSGTPAAGATSAGTGTVAPEIFANPEVQEIIAAARAGNKDAQAALDEKRIPWKQ